MDRIEEVKKILERLRRLDDIDMSSYQSRINQDNILDGATNQICQLFTEPKPDYIVCPFCGENNFDKMGLKYHLRNYCKEYQNTEDIPL